jgi:hypothetical protein
MSESKAPMATISGVIATVQDCSLKKLLSDAKINACLMNKAVMWLRPNVSPKRNH